MAMSTLDRQKVVEQITETTDDAAKAAHIVLLPEHLRQETTPQAYVMEARVAGFAIVALCGYEWIPSNNPGKLPVCQPCLDIYKDDPNGKGDRDRLPDA